MPTFIVGVSMLAFILGSVSSKKHHIGPCLFISSSEPCPDPGYVDIYLFTRKNNDTGQIIEVTRETDNLLTTNFNPKNPNKIIIHGFNTNMYLDVLQDIKTEYFTLADVNVWMVNYPKVVANFFCYAAAVENIEHVGKCLVPLVTALRRHGSNRVHIVGFSLGAHVPNYIANNLDGDKLDRITGLDPAGPLFVLADKKRKLDPSDAHFVDVVHTNAGMQGYALACGHIDFYMNGGISQPGCFHGPKGFSNCNHRRAPMYFAESINTKVGFLAWKCNKYVNIIRNNCKPNLERIPMGEHCPIGRSGLYLANTASKKPFALGNHTSDNYIQAYDYESNLTA